MSRLYTPNFKYPQGDLRMNQEFMDSSGHYNQQNHQLHNSSLSRYCSAPSSFLESLVNGNSSGGGNCEDYQYSRLSSPEIDTFLEKYMLTCNGSGDSGSHGLQEFGEKAMKQEEPEPINEQNEYSNGSSHMMYQNFPLHSLANDNSVNVGNAVDNSYSVASAIAMENSMQERMATGNGSNLIRQNSSPAELFSNLGVDNGFAGMRDGGCLRACNGTIGEASTTASRLTNRFNISPGPSSRFMPQISEIGNQRMGNGSPEKSFISNNGISRQYMPNFPSDSWGKTSFSGVKRATDGDCNLSFGLNSCETQIEKSGNQSTRLVHHLSFPKTSAEMAAVERFLNFQGSVPCKIRAKRGCATHPRSIAERVRRTRISERMRKLQDLFPNMDKQTNTADMLDLAVEYINDLQKQVKTLTDNKAKCRCSSKQKQYQIANTSA